MGPPLFLFRLVRWMLQALSVRQWFAVPVILAGLVLVLVGASMPNVISFGGRLALFACGAGLILASLGLYVWSGFYPEVPERRDVHFVSIKGGVDSFPRAPVNFTRDELVCKGSTWFQDKQGRQVFLRGVNLSGDTKVPKTPDGSTQNSEGFLDWQTVSFVGRPFPLDEADLHLSRLRAWGYTFLRFLVTWEAVEHAGPGQYDEEYIEYLVLVVRRCGDFGISVFVDFHQDAWSRWTGGDGAPAWTLLETGFNLENLEASGAAVTEQLSEAKLPKMVWNSNNQRLAGATMWTLFYAGNDFAPKTEIQGEPAQEFLQAKFCGVLARVAKALKNEPNVIGFDILNEPHDGYVGIPDMRDISENKFYIGWRVTPWDAIRAGAGETIRVPFFGSFLELFGYRSLNTKKVSAWTDPSKDVWLRNGVWMPRGTNGKPRLLKPHYFSKHPQTGRKIDFLKDYGVPFWKRASKAIRAEMPDAIIFAEPVLNMRDPMAFEKPEIDDAEIGSGYVWAKHWYDGLTLITKTSAKFGFDVIKGWPLVGFESMGRGYGAAIHTFHREAKHMGSDGGCPVLVGEVGIPYDMNNCKAFLRNDFTECSAIFNVTFRALETALVSFTLWNYTPDNSNKYGDNWNGEDLSIFSEDQHFDRDDLHSGGRSLEVVVRPYPFCVAGTPLHVEFQPYSRNRLFIFKYRSDRDLPTTETIIFLPRYQYPHGINVEVSDGTFEIDWPNQQLIWNHEPESSSTDCHTIHITKVRKPSVLSSKVEDKDPASDVLSSGDILSQVVVDEGKPNE